MKEKLNLIILSIILGVGIWILDIFADSYMFSKRSFHDTFIDHTTGHLFFFHVFLFIIFIFLALFILRLIENRKKAEAALEEYLILIETANDAIFIADCDTGIIINANRKAEEMLGIPVEMIKGMHQSELHPSEEADRYGNIFKEYIHKNSKEILMDLFVIHKTGRKIPVEISANVIEIGGKRIIQGIFRDASKRKKADEEIFNLSKFPSENPNPVLRINDIGTVLFKNQAAKNLLEKANLSERDIFRILPENVKELIPQILKTKTPLHDKEIKVGDRTYSYSLIPVAENQYVNIYTTDITDRKKYEQALIESERKFKSLYSGMTEGVALHEVIYDKIGKAIDYEIMDVNPAYEMITGLNREQSVGSKASELYGTGEPPYLDIYEKVAASGEPTLIETYFPPMKKHFSISVFSPAKGQFATIFQDITDRKQYERNLIESEKKFESLHLQARQDWEDTFETIPDMITIHDSDFNLIHANRAATEILNLPILDPKTINKCFKYYHGTGAPPEGCPSCDCYNTGVPATFEVFEPHLNRFIEIRAIPRFDKENKLIGLIHVVRDISKRKQMEEKLRDSEKRFHAAAICTADLIWEGDIRSDSLRWFGDIDSTLGYKAGEFPRTLKGFAEGIHPEDRDNVNKAVQKSLKSGRKLSLEFRMKCKKGIYRHWHESGKAVEFENNKAVKWVGSITDITARKMAEDRLIENEDKYKKLSQEFHTLLDAIPDSLILLSQDLKILWSNTAFDSKVGMKASACQAKHCYKLCCNISSPCNNCPVIKCFQSGKEEVTQVTDTNGRILDKRSFPIFDESGKVSKVIEVSRDVTAKNRMEDEAKLVQSRLIHANKMTSLGALVSGVAHEINNPNSYIMSNTQVFSKIWKDAVEILKENCHDKRDVLIGGIPFPKLLDLAPKLLIGINDGSVRISNIVDNLKNFSQPQRTDMDGKVNVNKVILSSRSILDHNIKQFTHNFHVNCNENIPPARGNTQQIEQVIINLIMNALQSLPDMTSEIWLSTSHNKKSNTVEIKVKDTGTGMSDDVLQQVTEPFFTTKTDTGGTGLGLSISYAIIKEHKGLMSFKSERGKGTTVTVTVPVYNRKDIIE